MKKYVLSLMLASAAVAEAQHATPCWSYSLPETGLTPSAFSCSFVSSMRERHSGDSHFGMQNVSLTIPFSDPYRSFLHGWAFNAELSSTLTFVDAEGTLDLKNDTLYRFSLPLSFIRKTQRGNRLILSASPTIASDMSSAARCIDLGLFAIYTHKVNERFNLSAGIAAYPRFARYYTIPFFGFEWKASERWTVSLRNFRLSALHAVSPRLSVGPFLASEGGVWSVETARGARLLSVQSLIAGVRGEYDFSKEGQNKRIISASLGTTLASSVRFHELHGDREADEAHHYRPGLHASFGIDCRF